MKEFLRRILSTATFRQSSLTTSGTIINGTLGALFYILAARILGPSDFGFLIVAITTLTLLADFADLGINNSLIRFVPKYIKTKQKTAYQFLKLALELKFALFLILAFLGWTSTSFLATIVFKKEILTLPLQLAFLGAGGALLFSFSTTVFQSLQRFWIWNGIQITINLFRLLAIILLWYFANSNLINSMSVYIMMPFIGFVISLLFMPRGFLGVKKEFSIAKQFFSYSKWVALFTVLASFSGRLDTFISARLLSPSEVGFYGAANQLVTIVPQIVVALGTVISPKMAGMGSRSELISYLKKTQLLSMGIAALGLLCMPVVIFMIPIIYGPLYAQSVPILFTILFLAMLVFLISIPIHTSVFYYFGYPQLFVWISLGHLLIIGILGWHLISLYGATGAATTVLVGTTFNFIIPLIWVLRKLKYG